METASPGQVKFQDRHLGQLQVPRDRSSARGVKRPIFVTPFAGFRHRTGHLSNRPAFQTSWAGEDGWPWDCLWLDKLDHFARKGHLPRVPGIEDEFVVIESNEIT